MAKKHVPSTRHSRDPYLMKKIRKKNMNIYKYNRRRNLWGDELRTSRINSNG